ncbi:hypothetical protein [Neobacillus sp. NPDC093127]|uniref:hypothetical protein n=1 Tax=Neobacillus sp. NPDC093127 TaxID=3364296 RepID=UPI0038257E73
MSLVIFSTISLLAAIYFAVKPKNLNTLELAMIMILVVYLDSNFMDIAILNLKRFIVSDKPADRFSFYLTFILLYPLVIAWSIDRLYSLPHKALKVLFSLFTIMLIVGSEQLTKYVKAVNYVDWNWRLDIAQWLTIWLISYILHLLFRKLVLKELNQ